MNERRYQTCIKATFKVLKMVTGSKKAAEGVAWDTDVDDLPEGTFVVPGLELIFKDDEGNEYTPQFLSAGSTKRLVPSENGEDASDEGPYLIPNPNLTKDEQKKIGITKKCALGYVLGELPNAGYPKNRLKDAEGNFSKIFEGLHAFWTQESIKLGTNPTKVIVPSKVEFEEDKKGSKKKAEKKEEPTLTDEEEEEAEEKFFKLVKAALKANDGSIDRKELAEAVAIEFEDEKALTFAAAMVYDLSVKKWSKAGYELDGETITKE